MAREGSRDARTRTVRAAPGRKARAEGSSDARTRIPPGAAGRIVVALVLALGGRDPFGSLAFAALPFVLLSHAKGRVSRGDVTAVPARQ